MTLPQEFWEELPQKTDAELYEILSHEEDYLPEALRAAKEELNKRNVAPERIAQLEKKAESQKKEENAKAEQRLSLPLRSWFFYFAAGSLEYCSPFITATMAIRKRPRTAG